MSRVLRAKPGQQFELSDGREIWLAQIDSVQRDAVKFVLVEPIPAADPRLRTVLLLSVVKFDRFEWALEKATELGVSEICPLSAARCEKALLQAAPRRALRWKKILFESAQQSRRLRPPELHLLTRANASFATFGECDCKVLFSELPTAPALRNCLKGVKAQSAAMAIGPEGGWTDEELAAARAAGFREASLGSTILRTETAVVA
ncbi:MAG TPA: RsmE family RNA methyltransferase, partial [Candidatus Nitrosotenuis sp.]|nr:RsmE family RNA methyltransferase [Candidatus Nitrosotenuis sp.]